MELAVSGAADLSRYGRRIVRMLWDPEPINNAPNHPVWCLGNSYLPALRKGQTLLSNAESLTTIPANAALDILPDSASSSFESSLAYEEENSSDDRDSWPTSFLQDFESRFWMTYRSGFQPIARLVDQKATGASSFTMILKTLGDPNGFSSDSGWGCMIRSGQSLLANTLAICELGRDWRLSDGGVGQLKLLSLFADDPRASYSIHRFVEHGASACGKYPGEWFGPSATASCIRALVNTQGDLLRVYTTGDLPDVYEDSFMDVAKPGGSNDVFHPTLILICTRLGIDTINTVYWEALTATLQMPQSVGIAGGRPASSHYFIGSQRPLDGGGSHLFYLDPHHTRPYLPYRERVEDYTNEEILSCHTCRLRQLHIREMDPSMLIGFLIKNDDDWDSWKSSVKHVQGKAIITVSDHDPAGGTPVGRNEAINEVEILSDEEDD